MAKNSQVSTYANGLLKLSIEWSDPEEQPDSVRYPLIELWRYDAYNTDNYGGRWNAYLNPDPFGSGAWENQSFGSGSGWRRLDYWNPRTYQKQHSSYTAKFSVSTNASFGTQNWNTGTFVTVGKVYPSKTFTIPAKWHSTITFDANGGSNAPSDTLTKWYGETGPAIPSQQPTRSGFIFKGWSADQSAVYASFDPEDTYSVEPTSAVDNIVLYAVWQVADVTVIFDDNSGSGGPGNTIATYGQPMRTITSLPTRTGYQFDGYWLNDVKYYNADGTSARICDQTAAFTLTAHWTANTYYVKFNANGGSGSMTNQTMTYDVPASLKVNGYEPPTSYRFSGWSLTTNGALLIGPVENLTAENGATVVVYARWELSNPEAYHFKSGSWEDVSGGRVFSWTMGGTSTIGATFRLKWTDRNETDGTFDIKESDEGEWEGVIEYALNVKSDDNSLEFSYKHEDDWYTRSISLTGTRNLRPYNSMTNNSWTDFSIECIDPNEHTDEWSFGMFIGRIKSIGKPTITRNAKSMTITYAAPSTAIRGYPDSVTFSYALDGEDVDFSAIDENTVGVLSIDTRWNPLVAPIAPDEQTRDEQLESTKLHNTIQMSSIRCPLPPTISSVEESTDTVSVTLNDGFGSIPATGTVDLGNESGTGNMGEPIVLQYKDYAPTLMKASAVRSKSNMRSADGGDYIYCIANGLYYQITGSVQIWFSVQQVTPKEGSVYSWTIDTPPSDGRIAVASVSNSITVDLLCTSAAIERSFQKARSRLMPTSVPVIDGKPATEVSFTPSSGGAPWLVDDEYRYDYYLYLGGKQVGALLHTDSDTSFKGFKLISPSETLLYIKTRDMDGNEAQSDSYVYAWSQPDVGIFVYKEEDNPDILIDNCLLEGMGKAIYCSAYCMVDIIDTDILIAQDGEGKVYEIESNGTVRESLNRWKR